MPCRAALLCIHALTYWHVSRMSMLHMEEAGSPSSALMGAVTAAVRPLRQAARPPQRRMPEMFVITTHSLPLARCFPVFGRIAGPSPIPEAPLHSLARIT